jgi:hypothetical protein
MGRRRRPQSAAGILPAVPGNSRGGPSRPGSISTLTR